MSPLLIDLYELTMAAAYWKSKRVRDLATFDLFVRRMPKQRNFLIFAGLENILQFILNFRFSQEEIDFLKSTKLFEEDFLAFLKKIRFTGEVAALPEGTIFFPNEPVIRVTAPIIEAQLLETRLLNLVNLHSTLASKAVRVILASQNKKVIEFGLRRTQGEEAGLSAARSAYLVGAFGTSNVLAGKLYKIPIFGTMAHSFIQSFSNEIEAFRAFARAFPKNTTFLVDTYDNIQGIRNAIAVTKELAKKNFHLQGIRLDSGDLITLSKTARKMLDQAGLFATQILASGNLDEYKIETILKKKAPIDSFGVGTAMSVSADYPFLDVVYKLSALSIKNIEYPKMKLSARKITLPGRKQIWRIVSKNKMQKDILGLAEEKQKGEPLLKIWIQKGCLIRKIENLNEARNNTLNNLSLLPQEYKQLNQNFPFEVEISPKLKNLAKKLSSQLAKL